MVPPNILHQKIVLFLFLWLDPNTSNCCSFLPFLTPIPLLFMWSTIRTRFRVEKEFENAVLNPDSLINVILQLTSVKMGPQNSKKKKYKLQTAEALHCKTQNGGRCVNFGVSHTIE